MSKTKLSIILLLLLSSINIYSQEELFSNKSGISALYLNGLGSKYSDTNGVGISAYFKNGICASAGYMNDANKISPIIGLSYFIKNTSKIHPTAAFGVSYVPDYKTIQLHVELIKTLFVNSNFPSSLCGGVTVNLEHGEKDNPISDVTPVIGLNYTQALFAKKIIYPFIGISSVYAPLINNYMFSTMIGMNFKLSAKED